jgi:ketosteroid isomerase-like protein
MTYRPFAVTLGVIGLVAIGASQLGAQSRAPTRSADSTAIVATAEQFHASLARGDSANAARLLAPDLVVMEAGGVEHLADYLSHHLGADIEFAKAVPSQRTMVSVVQQGDVAWVVGTSVTRGTFRDRPINSNGAELMVLTRSGSGWLIRAIHWSSRRGSP